MRCITVVIYHPRWQRVDQSDLLRAERIDAFITGLNDELEPFDCQVEVLRDDSFSIDVNGYGDLLNSIRIRAPFAGIGNLCLGHVIGPSQHLDLYQDIRRGVNRVLFAPETIEPEGSDKVVCHNCGCGC